MDLEGETCRGVLVKVVDDFQGEECDIILLSLVRSNEQNKIGFLKTDNRICVAISRAKHGLYIIGNMQSLTQSGSRTWQKIHENLTQDEMIGSHLELRCDIHGDITAVENQDDFNTVPEGGCSKMCEAALKCGHSCASVCHVMDQKHEEYNCRKPCERKCPNQHGCKELCFKVCPKCMERMDKPLACGHIKTLPCYQPEDVWKCMEPVMKTLPCGHERLLNCRDDPEKVLCVERVTRELPCRHIQIAKCWENIKSIDCISVIKREHPTCGHEVEIQCFESEKIDQWKCLTPCDTRMDCGHTCDRICHFGKDPDHLQFVCRKPCARSCPAEHRCRFPHRCSEKCQHCDVEIEKTLPCGHKKMMLCYLDPDSVLCQEPCAKILDCGHACSRKCFSECSPCLTKVDKQSVNCVHTLNVPCHQVADRSLCEKRVISTATSLCDHTVLVPCRIQHAITPEGCLEYCEQPCGFTREDGCKHPCKGTCSSCFQGRIHQRCNENCGRPLPCGHFCKFPCAKLCPPCNENCLFTCSHSKCKKKCGLPCTGCSERCEWICPHKKCTKLCKDECNREECDEPCPVVLPCGHPCIGLCGEKCPDLCRVCCDPEEFYSKVGDFDVGTKEDEDSRFICLEDCGHIFEVTAMDMNMRTDTITGAIGVKRCAVCTTVIQSSGRYKKILNNRAKDIIVVKRRAFGNEKDIKNRVWKLVQQLQNSKIDDKGLGFFLQFLSSKTFELKIVQRKSSEIRNVYIKKIDQYTYESLENMKFWFTEATKNLTESPKFRIIETDKTDLLARYQKLFRILMKRLLPLSRQEILDFGREFTRLSHLHQLQRRHGIENFKAIAGAEYKYNQAIKEVFTFHPYTLKTETNFKAHMKMLDQLIVAIVATWKSEEVTAREIFRAVGFGANHWYKCPNGHYYVIADCGQPNATSNCPDCKSTVGAAGYHRMAAGNSRVQREEEVIRNMSVQTVPNVDFINE